MELTQRSGRRARRAKMQSKRTCDVVMLACQHRSQKYSQTRQIVVQLTGGLPKAMGIVPGEAEEFRQTFP